MSLTSRLRGSTPEDKQFQLLLRSALPDRSLFYTASGTTPFSPKQYQMKAAPMSSGRGQSSLVGTAFDLLARAVIARIVDRNKAGVTAWLVAEQGLDLLQTSGFVDGKTIKQLWKVCMTAVRTLDHYAHRKAGVDIEDVIEPCCKLARLERLARGGVVAQLMYLPDLLVGVLSVETPEVSRDLERLISVFSNAFICSGAVASDSEVVFNPKFLAAEIGGADADVLIDGTLYDFKTSRAPGYKWQDIAQLWGYYLLSETSGVYDKGAFALDSDSLDFNRKVERLGLYKARFGEIEYVRIDAIDPGIRAQAVRDFRDYLART